MLWQVLGRGCNVWMSPPPFDHTKLMVIDGAWAMFGSGNWDERSMRLNFEFNVETYDRDLASRLDAHVQAGRLGGVAAAQHADAAAQAVGDVDGVVGGDEDLLGLAAHLHLGHQRFGAGVGLRAKFERLAKPLARLLGLAPHMREHGKVAHLHGDGADLALPAQDQAVERAAHHAAFEFRTGAIQLALRSRDGLLALELGGQRA